MRGAEGGASIIGAEPAGGRRPIMRGVIRQRRRAARDRRRAGGCVQWGDGRGIHQRPVHRDADASLHARGAVAQGLVAQRASRLRQLPFRRPPRRVPSPRPPTAEGDARRAAGAAS
jgi:hypothetical protein